MVGGLVLRPARQATGLAQGVEVRLVVEAPLRRLAAEEDAEEVVGVVVVARPAEQVDPVLRGALDLVEVVRVPLVSDRLDLETDGLQLRTDHVEGVLGLGHVGTADPGRVVELDGRTLGTGFLEQSLRSEEHTSELQSLMRISY